MVDIDHRLFRRLDLNLLVALDALLTETSVSRAAARLCLGQPAMSHALARLRAIFGDELLYREGSGMRLTARARALAPGLRRVLEDTLALTRESLPFDPARAEGQVRLALNDPLEALLLPGIMARIRAAAPGLLLSVQPIPASRQLEELDRGEISLALGYFPHIREMHQLETLYRSRFHWVYNPHLLPVPEAASLAEMVAFPHIHTTYTGETPGMLDRALASRGLTRRVVAHTATPLSIPFVVKRSPLIAVLPDLITRLFANHQDLRMVPVDLPELVLPVGLLSHRRDQGEPLIGFVARQITESARELFGQGTSAGQEPPASDRLPRGNSAR